MTDDDRELKVPPHVSQKYRELGAEEPPRALDDAILAAARREVGARPGSPGRAAPRRWVGSLAAAAVLVLAVAVTLHMQREQPDIAQPAPAVKEAAAPSAKQPATIIASAPTAAPAEMAKEAVKPMIAKTVELSRPSEPEPFPARSDRAADAPHVPAARQAEERVSREAEAPAPAPQAGAAPAMAMAKRAAAQGNLQAETPERELERIAELRRQERHDEADKALAEFRKRYPDYKIPSAMLERIEKKSEK